MTSIADMTAQLEACVASDFPFATNISDVENALLEMRPATLRDAGALLAVAASLLDEDVDPDLRAAAQAAVRRVASLNGALSPSLSSYYGTEPA